MPVRLGVRLPQTLTVACINDNSVLSRLLEVLEALNNSKRTWWQMWMMPLMEIRHSRDLVPYLWFLISGKLNRF